MTNIMEPSARRDLVLGRRVAAKLQTLSGAATHQLFTVTGGNVLITAMWGVTTVEMAGANSVNVQVDPTTGDTVVVAFATDLGTTNTAAGTLIGALYDQDGTHNIPDLVKGAGQPLSIMVPIGEVESVVTEVTADGAIQWYCTWVPLDDGATLVASA